jgi:hypothetical protein
MQENNLVKKIEENLFCDEDQTIEVFHENEINKVKRIRWAFSKWLSDPLLSDRDIRRLLMSNFAISENTSLRDMPIVLSLMGNVKNASKDFFRMKANAMVADAFKQNSSARTLLEVKQADVSIKAAIAIAKINKLDKEDIFPHAWDDIIPSEYEISSSVSVLGLKPVAESVAQLEALKFKLRKKYNFSEEIISDIKTINEEKETENLSE